MLKKRKIPLNYHEFSLPLRALPCIPIVFTLRNYRPFSPGRGRNRSVPSMWWIQASYIIILAHAYAHRKSRGSTDRKCNMAMGGLPNPAKTQGFPTLDPASTFLAHAYAHRKPWRSTGRKCNMAMGRPPNPAKTQCFPTLDPASYILAHAYAHCKSRGSTDRKCNMAMGGLPNPAKTQCFHTLDPASYILAHAYAHRKSRGFNRLKM